MTKKDGYGGVQKPPRRGEVVKVTTDQRDKTIEQKMKEHLRRVEEHKKIEREIRKWKNKKIAKWVERLGGDLP
jgi:hypothetical protein